MRKQWRGAGHCGRFRKRPQSGKCRPNLRNILYNQDRWHGDGPVDLPLDHRIARRTFVGFTRSSPWRGLSVYFADRRVAAILGGNHYVAMDFLTIPICGTRCLFERTNEANVHLSCYRTGGVANHRVGSGYNGGPRSKFRVAGGDCRVEYGDHSEAGVLSATSASAEAAFL